MPDVNELISSVNYSLTRKDKPCLTPEEKVNLLFWLSRIIILYGIKSLLKGKWKALPLPEAFWIKFRYLPALYKAKKTVQAALP